MKYLIIFGLMFLLIVAACTQQAQTDAQQKTQAEAQPAEKTADSGIGTEDASNIVKISMVAKQWEFDPATVTVKEGDKVRLTIKSIDVAHGFTIPDFDVSQRLEPGKTEIVEFTADKKGTYTFFCSVACGTGHRSMKGSLVVE